MQSDEIQSFLSNPYKYICDFIESTYLNVGRKSFEILALVPCSHILPDLKRNGEKERTNLNVLFLTFSGGAKSSILRRFQQIAYEPISVRSQTSASLEDDLSNKIFFSLLIEDYAVMSTDPRVNKLIEGILGEEKRIQRKTKRKDIDEQVEAVALLCGVPSDLSNKVTSGILSRVVCLAITHTDEQHSQIGRHIASTIGKETQSEEKLKIIQNYYRLLQLIQAEEYEEEEYNLLLDFFGLEKKKYPSIKDYEISNTIKEQLNSKWDLLSTKFRQRIPFNWFREQLDGFRFLVSHAFLNYFRREIEKHILKISTSDFEIASKLLKETMMTKYNILLLKSFENSIRTWDDYNKVMNSEKVPEIVKHILPFHINRRRLY